MLNLLLPFPAAGRGALFVWRSDARALLPAAAGLLVLQAQALHCAS